VNPAGLERHRAVQLIAYGDADEKVVGSGYLTTERLVLTAAHVVAAARRVTVRAVTGPREVREAVGVTVWSDRGADIAVVRLNDAADGAAPLVDGLPPLRYGRIQAHVGCEALGFPRFKLRGDRVPAGATESDRYRDTHHAIGTIAPFSNLRQGTLEISVLPPEYDAAPPHSPWEGMSGAAVFVGGVIVGLVSEHQRADGLNRLVARPVTQWYELAGLTTSLSGYPVVVTAMGEADAREILASRVGPERVAAEPEAVAEILVSGVRSS
jgi:hypothetical protein